jgi:hypothetical protein
MFNSRNLLVGLIATSVSFDVVNWTGLIASAEPDPIFKPVLGYIQRQIPKQMSMRLPSFFPNAPTGIAGYRPEVFADPQNGYFAVIIATSNCPQPVTAVCDTGRLFSAKRGSNAENWFQETKSQGNSIQLTSKVIGFYRSYRHPTRGNMKDVMWEQDGLIYGVKSRSMTESEVINIAVSMANEPAIYDSSYTLIQNITNSPQKKCLLFTGNGWANVYRTLSDAQSPSGIKRSSFSFILGFNDMVEILDADEQNRYLKVTPVQGRFRDIEKINDMFGWLNLSRDSALEQVACPANYTTIPSIPSSSTPVKPTDAIAKYPTNEDFNAFEDKLQGNPESLVKLRGNQAEQRRKFQNDWKARNPNAAKFLGSWYTGNRYFYVFPSTEKSRTCVVTHVANGKLDMQIGTVLNQELRYGGGKGFFWRDRENIVASRDSGNGDLYPIYATYEVPELPASMISDMESQKCITTLPFEADAQYYKERGDKFAKLGKKDEAISNYRKALDLLRKQNQFAQAKAIESQIVKLGGSIK